MKKLLILLLCSILILCGCAPKQETSTTIPQMSPDTTPEIDVEPTVAESTETIISEAKHTELLAVSVPATTEHYALEDGIELFTYTTQHMELLLSNDEIADKVILDFLNRVDTARLDAESVMRAAQNDYDPTVTWYPYSYQILYSPTRLDHNVLSLFGSQNSYSGGTHGSLSCVSVNYDLSTGDTLTLGSILHLNANKNDLIELVIQELGKNAKELQLFDGYEDGVYNRLGGDENLYEDFYFTESGLNFFFAPYEIAPYAAGVITVEIPYGELTGILYDGYFPAEREQVSGNINIGNFMETDMEQFNNMAEVMLTTGEELFVIYPEGTVENVQITVPGDAQCTSQYTVFSALEMSENNAVVLSIDAEQLPFVTVTYTSNNEQVSVSID